MVYLPRVESVHKPNSALSPVCLCGEYSTHTHCPTHWCNKCNPMHSTGEIHKVWIPQTTHKLASKDKPGSQLNTESIFRLPRRYFGRKWAILASHDTLGALLQRPPGTTVNHRAKDKARSHFGWLAWSQLSLLFVNLKLALSGPNSARTGWS